MMLRTPGPRPRSPGSLPNRSLVQFKYLLGFLLPREIFERDHQIARFIQVKAGSASNFPSKLRKLDFTGRWSILLGRNRLRD